MAHSCHELHEGTRRYQRSPLFGGIELLTADYRRHVFPPHAQDTVVIGVVEQGQIEVQSGGHTLTVAEDDVLVIPSGVVHGAHSASDERWTYRALYLLPSQWASIAEAIGLRGVGHAAHALRCPNLQRSLRLLHARLSESRAGESNCRHVLGAVAEEVAAVEASHEDPLAREVASAIERVRLALDAAVGRRVSLSEMARLAGLSRFHFLRAFTRAYGVTPYAYSVNQRVMAARRLLVRGRPISMAALEAGFADQAHLTRVFLRTVGVTPGEYRRAFVRHATGEQAGGVLN